MADSTATPPARPQRGHARPGRAPGWPPPGLTPIPEPCRGPLPDATAIRAVKVPQAAPPYDDIPAAARPARPGREPRSGRPPGPAREPVPGVGPVGRVPGAGSERIRAGAPDAGPADPVPAPRPAADPWPGRFAQALAEALAAASQSAASLDHRAGLPADRPAGAVPRHRSPAQGPAHHRLLPRAGSAGDGRGPRARPAGPRDRGPAGAPAALRTGRARLAVHRRRGRLTGRGRLTEGGHRPAVTASL